MRLTKEYSCWYSARVTVIPTFIEIMLTVQNMQGNLNQWIDAFVHMYPGKL